MLKNAIMISTLLIIAFFTQPKQNQTDLKRIQKDLLLKSDLGNKNKSRSKSILKRGEKMLREAIKEQWLKRFGSEDPSYVKEKHAEVDKLKTYDALLSHCMNIDQAGRGIIADMIKMSHRDFAFLLSAHRAMSQGHIYKGESGFSYKTEKITKDGKQIETYTYPDGTTVSYQLG